METLTSFRRGPAAADFDVSGPDADHIPRGAVAVLSEIQIR